MNLDFLPKRLSLLLKRDAVSMYRQSLVVAGAVSGVYLVIYLLSVFALSRGGNVAIQISPNKTDLHTGLFAPLLYLGGFIVTSRGFSEVHNRNRNHDWFMLPASTSEKLVGRWLLTSIGFAITATVGYSLFSMIAAGSSLALMGSAFPLFNPFKRAVLLMIANYLVIQSLFLLGAVYFKKNHFLKTVITLICTAIVLGIFGAAVFRLVYWGYFDGLVPNAFLIELFESVDSMVVTEGLERIGRGIETMVKVLYWAFFAPVFVVITFFRLGEAEVKDGV